MLTSGIRRRQSRLLRFHGVDFVTGQVLARDLNLGLTDPAESLAHATDVELYEPVGGARRVCVTAFNSDGFAMLDVSDPAVQIGWRGASGADARTVGGRAPAGQIS